MAARILPAVDVSSRIPGLVFLALVVVAAALLLAGLGVAVGAGLLVGLALGLLVGLTVVLRRPRGPISFLSSRPGGPEPDHELLMRHHRDQVAVTAVDASELRRVLTVLLTAEAAGIRIELVAVELRADGGVAHLVARARPPAWIGQLLDVTVSDDAGTAYAAAGQSQGGPNPGVGRIELRFAPTPPARARRLTLRVDAFLDPFPGPARRLPGPWTFELDVAGDGAGP